jgi:hypothetical protein
MVLAGSRLRHTNRRRGFQVTLSDVTTRAKAAALGGVGPRHARRSEAADKCPPSASYTVTHDRESSGRSYAATRPFLPVMRDRGSALAGGRGRTGTDPAETADAGLSRWGDAETADAGLSRWGDTQGTLY